MYYMTIKDDLNTMHQYYLYLVQMNNYI